MPKRVLSSVSYPSPTSIKPINEDVYRIRLAIPNRVLSIAKVPVLYKDNIQ